MTEKEVSEIIKDAKKQLLENYLFTKGVVYDNDSVTEMFSEIFNYLEKRFRDTLILESATAKEKLPDTTSHSETAIYESCVELLHDLAFRFVEYLEEVLDIDVEYQDEDERFSFCYTNFEIIQRLFLRRTNHSGGTSTRLKCKELGIDFTESIVLDALKEKRRDD